MNTAKTTVVIATRDRAPELERTLRELTALRPPRSLGATSGEPRP